MSDYVHLAASEFAIMQFPVLTAQFVTGEALPGGGSSYPVMVGSPSADFPLEFRFGKRQRGRTYQYLFAQLHRTY